MKDKLIEQLDTFCQKELGTNFNKDILDKFADHLLANGVIVPPCKVGDVVYVKYYGEIVNAYVTEFEINSKGIVAKVYIDPDTDREYDAEDLFLTREEAEKALQEVKGK